MADRYDERSWERERDWRREGGPQRPGEYRRETRGEEQSREGRGEAGWGAPEPREERDRWSTSTQGYRQQPLEDEWRRREQGNWGRTGEESTYGQSSSGQGFQGPGTYGQREQTGQRQGSYGHSNYGQGSYGATPYSEGMPGETQGSYGRGMQDQSGYGHPRGVMGGRYQGKGPKAYQRSDERIREDVCERLTEHPDVDASEIEIAVENGEVTLTGTVEDRYQKRLSEDVAESVLGVREVHNQLRVPKGMVQRLGESLGIGDREAEPGRPTTGLPGDTATRH